MPCQDNTGDVSGRGGERTSTRPDNVLHQLLQESIHYQTGSPLGTPIRANGSIKRAIIRIGRNAAAGWPCPNRRGAELHLQPLKVKFKTTAWQPRKNREVTTPRNRYKTSFELATCLAWLPQPKYRTRARDREAPHAAPRRRPSFPRPLAAKSRPLRGRGLDLRGRPRRTLGTVRQDPRQGRGRAADPLRQAGADRPGPLRVPVSGRSRGAVSSLPALDLEALPVT